MSRVTEYQTKREASCESQRRGGGDEGGRRPCKLPKLSLR